MKFSPTFLEGFFMLPCMKVRTLDLAACVTFLQEQLESDTALLTPGFREGLEDKG